MTGAYGTPSMEGGLEPTYEGLKLSYTARYQSRTGLEPTYEGLKSAGLRVGQRVYGVWSLPMRD